MRIHDNTGPTNNNWTQTPDQQNYDRLQHIFNTSNSVSNNLYQSKSKSREDLMSSLRKLGGFTPELQNDQQRSIAKRLMELEGQCKITQWQFVRVNQVRAVFMMIIIIITLFGLFLLKYYARFRKFAFFQNVSQQEATHVFVKDNDKKYDIVKIESAREDTVLFFYKKLKYSISSFNKRKPTPVAFQFERVFAQCFKPDHLTKGLTQDQIVHHQQKYGLNQHLVETPSFPEYLLDVLTQPFFLLQYFFCFVFFMQGYAPFSYALLFFSFLTTTINYIMLYISYKKIKEIAERTTQVTVIRDGKQQRIDSKQLVPGDIYIPQQQSEVAADCIIGSGDIYVNQANLTGESMPIGKFQIQFLQQIDVSNTWIYEGSKVLQTKQGNTFAIVINTGFTTHRGRIVRKILNRTVKDPDMLRSTMIFVIEVTIMSMITFFATLYLQLTRDIDKLFVFFKFIDFLVSSAPPPLPIFFNLAYSFSLYRLSSKGISGTEPQKTVEGSRIKIFCFDKTGTLTRPEVRITKVLKISNNQSKIQFNNIIPTFGALENLLSWQCFATCHTTKIINNELLGDQIDKQMFNFINAKMENSEKKSIRIIIKSTPYMPGKAVEQVVSQKSDQSQKEVYENARKVESLLSMKKQICLQVLRINQFESKFQSMSVFVRDANTNQYFIFAKGSPEKLVERSKNIKTQNNLDQYHKKIRVLSFNGLRTICYGSRQIKKKEEIQKYLLCDRDLFLQDLHVEGLVCFENKLKNDTKQTMNRLTLSNIQSKMITGDSLFIAAETARRAGIIDKKEKVVFLSGRANYEVSNLYIGKRIFKGLLIGNKESQKQIADNMQKEDFEETKVEISQQSEYLKGDYTFAVDNEFLTLETPPILSNKIKVFARIPPQNKALIIKRYKQQQNEAIKTKYSAIIRWLRIKNTKIGMCGDGANDLMALREADLSVGIQATDASYGSSFNVKNMLDVDEIIRQSKCAQANIVHLYQFYGSIAMLLVCSSIILITDTTYFSSGQLMYLNFCAILLTPVMISLSKPNENSTQFVPDSNMMGINNHLIFWGNLIIPFLGVLGSWLYYSNTQDFVPNSQKKVGIETNGFNSKNQSTTLIYVLMLLTTAINGFITYRSKPWRQKNYTNYILTFLIVINLALAFIFAFFNDKISEVFEFKLIPAWHMSICLGIMVGTLAISLIYNLFVESFKLEYKELGVKPANPLQSQE